MPIYKVQAPDGKVYKVEGPEGATEDQLFGFVSSQIGFQPAEAQPQEGIGAALAGGFKRFLSTGETAAESIIDPELAAKRGLERAQQLGQQYAPGASLEKVKQAYAERGFFPAVGEAISQIPTALAEQAPQIAATLGSAKAGALAGSAFGPVGSFVGGLGGATIPSLIQLYGANIERQAQEKAPEISRTAALGAAVPGAALEVASTFIPLGRNLVGKLLGPGAAQALARGSNEAIERAAQESLTTSLLKGTSVGLMAEIPTEVTQQMLERFQAGLPLTTEDALQEYGEAAYGAGLVGGPFGAGARALGRPAAREQFEQLQQEEAARLAVSEEELAQRFPDVLPGGFKIEREELGKEMAPQGFSIMVEGRDEPLSVVDTQEEADAKFESLTKIRAEERENLLKEEEKINTDVQKARDKLERLEATEQTNTEEYQALKAEFPAMMDESAQKIKDLYDRSESLAKPLTVVPFGEVERVNEQFKVIGPDAKPVGTFKTLGEAEATVQQTVGEDVFKQTQQRRETAKELYKTFVPQMRKFGLGDVGLNIVDRIENGAGGAYLNKLIRVSLEDTTPVQTMRHESLHAMKDLGFFTPQQWRALEERANKQWIKEFLEGQKTKVNGQEMTRLEGYRKLGYSEQDIVEEAIADAFGSYDRGAKPPPGMIAALFKKIKNFFSSLGQALRGAGFQSADDIFQQIERGKLKPAAQPAVEAKPVVEEKLSLAPKGIPQKIWALHEKAQLADEESTGRIAAGKAPGTLKRNQTMTFRRLNKEVMDFVGGDQQKALDLMSRMNAVSGIREAIENQDDQALEIYRVSNPEVYAQEVGGEKLSLRVANKVGKQLDLAKEEIDSTSISLQTGKAGVDQFKKQPVGGLPQVVQFLEDRRKTSGLKNLDITSEEDREELAKLMAAEAMAAINAGGNALQWYDSVIDSMMNMASLKYPELATNEDNKAALRMAIAIASQGLNVEDNLTFAMSQYDYFRQNGRFKETGSGADGAAMKSNFTLANQMIEQYGLTDLRKFLQTEFTVEELRGAGFDIGGELGDEKVTGSAIFGPKIGFGFYSNLSGNFEPVTMDMWFMRTVGRLTGKLKGFDQKKFDDQLKRFRESFSDRGEDGLYADEFKDEEIQKAMDSVEGAVNLSRLVNSVFNSDFKNNRELYDEGARKKTDLVYAAQNIIKSFDAPKDAPQNGTERRLLRDVVARTVDKVAKAYGKRIPPASLQALIWYPEQELYKALGVKLRVTSQDYAGAIKKLLMKEGYNESTIDGAAKSGPRAVQPVAGKQVQAGVAPTGKKPQAAFEPTEREEFLEKRKTEQVIKQEREAPRRKKVIFEVAPDPNNVELTERWNALPQADRLRISNGISKKIIEQAKADLDFDGRVVSQVGSYLNDTNPSFALFLEKGDAVEISKFLGYALSQDSMMVVSPKPAPGMEKVGAVVVDVRTQSPSEVDAIYQKLREISVDGEQPVGGQTTMNNKMIVLNYSGVKTEELAQLIDKKLGGTYDVQYTDVYSAFPEKKDYDYASPENDPRGKGKAVRERARALRADATKLLEEELGTKAQAPAREEKFSLKAPTSPAFKQWFGESKIVNKDGEPMVMYHGTRRDFTTPETRGNRNAFFVSPDPNFANKYALNDLDWYPDKKGFGPVEEGAQVYPVYISAKNPFDYENADHLAKIIPNFRKALKEREGYDRSTIEDLVDDLRAGKWTSVEFANDYDLFELAGFDAFYTKEMGRKNLGVLYPNQIKSATGNMGTYSAESPDIRYSLKRVGFPTAKEAKDAVKKAVMPDNEAFKLYNAGNQWVDKDGKPRVFYHATAREFFEFTPAGQSQAIFLAETPEEAEGFGSIAEDKLRREIYRALNKEEKLGLFQSVVNKAVEDKAITQKQGEDFMRQANRKVPEYGSFGDIEQNVYDALLDLSPTRMTIMPLYARAMTPFDFENKDHVNQVIGYIEREIDLPMDFPEKWLIGMKGRISQGLWQAIEDKRVQQAIRALGFDAFTVRENRTSPKNYAVYKPEQVKSVTGNDGQFSLETKDIRYSLPTLSQAAKDRIKEVAPGRIELGWTDRVIGGFKRDFTWLRQAAINRYDSLAKYDKALREQIRKAGGPELLADQSAEFAALQSDVSAGVAASAMGIGERQGGVPVYRNGFTTIDTSVKGLTEALAPLAKYGDPEVYQRYQFWAGWKRGRRLLKEGREELYNAADAKLAKEIEAQHPEFVQVQKDLIAFNNGIVNFAVQTGVLSRERAQVYTQYSDYIPFYRQLDLDKTIGPNPFSGISGVRGPKALKGGEAPLADFLETMVRNTQSMINAGMKNAAAQKATKVAEQINQVERLPRPATGIDIYTQLENGQVVYYRANDHLFVEALKSLNMPDLPFMGLLSTPANVLRSLVTKDPGFMMANLLRDSLSSYVTSGQKITPIVGTMVNFGKALSAKDKTLQALFNAGIIGGYEFSQNIIQSGKTLSDDLSKKAGKDAIFLRPFKSLWEGLEKGTTASDAATRMAVYERVMKETGNEAEAISRAMEVMNFNRKGSSPLIRVATAALPFFNARLQGLDLFYRASTGQMNTQDAKEIKTRFWVRGATMMALSIMYYISVADDEEYEKQEQETKDNNWIFPSLGIRIPTPFEVGTLFKTMPERITAYLMGNDTGQELKDSTIRALANTFGFNPIPQAFKPLVEVATNYNFFTMRPIVGQGMQEVAPQFQVGPGTSKTAEYIGGLLNLSPLKVDQLIKGYTGTIGGYATDVVDSITSQYSDVPKASLRFEQLPVVKRFALDPEARGAVTQFYELQRSVDTVVRTMSLLEKTARPEEFAQYVQDNIGILATKDTVRNIEREMKQLRDMRRLVNSSNMEPDEKRDLLTDIGRMENNLTINIGAIKKAVNELK